MKTGEFVARAGVGSRKTGRLHHPLMRLAGLFVLAFVICPGRLTGSEPERHPHVFSMSVKATSFAPGGDLVSSERRAWLRAWLATNGFTKVYLESYRHNISAPTDVLTVARDEFEAAGFTVCGLVTPTCLDLDPAQKPKTGHYTSCFGNPRARARLKDEIRRCARLFNVILLDDFLFAACPKTCPWCGDDSPRFRLSLINAVCREILVAAREVNPDCRCIIKYPCWHADWERRGLVPSEQTAIFGSCWVGSETRDAGKDPYWAYTAYDEANALTGGRCGGVWFDPLDSSPEKFLEQAYYSILGGAPETLVHCYDYMLGENAGSTPFGESFERAHTCGERLIAHMDELRRLAAFCDCATRVRTDLQTNGVSRHEYMLSNETYVVRLNTRSETVDDAFGPAAPNEFVFPMKKSEWFARRFSPASREAIVRAAVAKGHPRLFASAAEFEALRHPVPGTLRALAVARVRERAEGLLAKPPLTYQVVGRRLLETSRTALYRLSTLAMAFRLTQDERFLRRARAELTAVCAFPDWNPSHFLDTAEMSLAVSLAYDWLASDLTPDERTRVLSALAKHGLEAGFGGGHWTHATNNWGQVCRAGMIAASLVLADDETRVGDCARMLAESVEALPLSMASLSPDGCFPEGLGYWNYGISFNVYAIAMLESACGTDFALSEEPGFLETADYPNALTGPTGMGAGFSDCGSMRGAEPSLWWFARRLNRPDLIGTAELAAWKDPPGRDFEGWHPPVDLFWMDDRLPTTRPGERPLVYAPRGKVPVAVLRSGWAANDAFVALKGGSPSASHGHMDGGNFVFEMGGVRWAWELPCEDYDRIERMKTVSLWKMGPDSGRWSLFRLNAFGHNVPTIDGAPQDVTGCATFLRTAAKPEPVAEMDLSSLYPQAKRVTRTCHLASSGDRLVIRDTFEGLRPGATIRWPFVIRSKASASGAELVLTEGDRQLRATGRGSSEAVWRIDPAEGNPPLDSPNPGFLRACLDVRADATGAAFVEVVFSLCGGS